MEREHLGVNPPEAGERLRPPPSRAAAALKEVHGATGSASSEPAALQRSGKHQRVSKLMDQAPQIPGLACGRTAGCCWGCPTRTAS